MKKNDLFLMASAICYVVGFMFLGNAARSLLNMVGTVSVKFLIFCSVVQGLAMVICILYLYDSFKTLVKKGFEKGKLIGKLEERHRKKRKRK